MTRYFKDKVVWITGASSGIGEALAMEFAQSKAKLVLSARRVKELERVQALCLQHTTDCMILPLDLAENDSLSGKVDNVIAHFGQIDILINNGGIGQRGAALDSPMEVERKIMEVNYFGAVALSKFVGSEMKKRQTGHIAVVSSILGKFGIPYRSTYAASKHALQGYFESVTPEFKENNIDVTLLCPGYVKTKISLNAVTEDGTAHGKMDQGQNKGMDPEECAAQIMKAIRNKKKEVYIGGREISMVYIRRYFPALYRYLLPKSRPIQEKNMRPVISGIQQVGIGVSDVHEAWEWYRKAFGMQIPVFEEVATANLMLPYTGGQPRKRHAVLALNPEGGGGMEIWQYTERKPQSADFEVKCGDLGIFVAKVKSRNIKKTYDRYQAMGLNVVGSVTKTPNGEQHFYLKDPYGNLFEIVESRTWFKSHSLPSGGPVGCTIGVTDMDKSIAFYEHILGYDTVVYDETGKFDDLAELAGGKCDMRRVLLKHRDPRKGAFSKFFGESVIELWSVKDRKPEKIYNNRFWGDLGFIHLCFDINGMDELRERCQDYGHPFSVDSATKHDETFDMGEASGQFSYIEDPDGTLIEFVETHKIPIMKKIGWYVDLRKRKIAKPLPDIIFKAMSFNRVRD